jgi:hypothetical protein
VSNYPGASFSRARAKLTVIEKGGIPYLVPERPIAEMRGIACGTRRKGLREKKDRL